MLKNCEIPLGGKILFSLLSVVGLLGSLYTITTVTWSSKVAVIIIVAVFADFFRLAILHGFVGFGGPLILGCLVSGLFSLEELLLVAMFQQIPRFFDQPRTPLFKIVGNLSESMTTLIITWAVWKLLNGNAHRVFSLAGVFVSLSALFTYIIVNHLIISLLIVYVHPRPKVTLFEKYKQLLRTSLTTIIVQYFIAILIAGIVVELGSSDFFLFGIFLFFISGLLGLLSINTQVQKTSLDEQLRTNQEFLHDLIANMDDALIACDSEGRIVHINAAAQRLVKEPVERGDLIGETPFQPLLAIKEHDTSEYNLNGRLLRVRKIPVSTTSSGNTGVVLLFEDITERKVIEDYAMHKDRLTLLGEFSAGIMHEIGKPLTMLSVAYDEIAATGLTDKNLEILGRSIDKLADLSRQLLNFSKPSPGRGKTMTNITQILTETVGIAELLAKKKRINIEIDAGYELIADIDEHEVRQVLLNLISNAIDVTPASGTISFAVGSGSFTDASESIWVRDYRAGRQSQGWFSVADQGPGFADEVIARLGNSFVTTKSEGHGLGFSIVLLLIKRWNARMSIYRLAPSGSRIVVEV